VERKAMHDAEICFSGMLGIIHFFHKRECGIEVILLLSLTLRELLELGYKNSFVWQVISRSSQSVHAYDRPITQALRLHSVERA
jgi:hypothetical protein